MNRHQNPPIKAFTSGRCYRRDTPDATHTPVFHQMDCIAIDKNISFSDLKWTLYTLVEGIFGRKMKLRFRPSYFPFTTPSAEVDIAWIKNGEEKWLEILGAGMMRPEVLKAGGIDPEQYSGFAFGIGLERVAMLSYEIEDIRYFYNNHQQFLNYF